MSTRPYPSYVSSGLDWIGSVPEGWAVEPLGRHMVSRNTTVSDSDFRPLSVTRNGVVPQLDNVAKTSNGDARKLVRAGDFAINSRSDRKGSAGLAEEDGSVSVITTVLAPRNVHGRYIHHLLRSEAFQEEYYRYGSGIVADLWSTRWSAMKNIRIPLPSLDEQQAIADFLDRETGEIDAFIRDQEELIGLLQERRAATISHAVTKGLDDEVSLRPSGSAWLGHVPREWTVQKLGRQAKIRNGSTPSRNEREYWLDGTIPWLSSTVVNLPEVVAANESVTSRALEECHLPMIKAGSLLVGLTGQGKTRGMVTRLRFTTTINQHLAAVTLREGMVTDFVYWVLSAAYNHLRFVSDGNGGTKGGLTCEELAALDVPVPQRKVQEDIASFLERAVADIDAAIDDGWVSIRLSQERRVALISAAVTGKIDVREHVEV